MWKVDWAVEINGSDKTDVMSPYLMSVETVDGEGATADTASLVFDDRDGRLRIPVAKEELRIRLNGVEVFFGKIDDPEWELSRGGGRVLKVSAKGFDSRGKVKEAQDFYMDNATLESFLSEAGKRAGISKVIIDPEFANIRRDYWSADGESFIHLGPRIANEVGGTFKIKGDKAVLAKRGTGKAPNGGELPVVIVDCAKNTTSARIKTGVGRSDYRSATIEYFDRQEAKWKKEEVDIKTDDADSTDAREVIRYSKADKEQARLVGEGRKASAARDGGGGSVTMDLDVVAVVEGTARIVNARDGIDGDYRIRKRKHRADRNGGATTELTIGEPPKKKGKKKKTKDDF